jgi:hypothetical protein
MDGHVLLTKHITRAPDVLLVKNTNNGESPMHKSLEG